MVLSRLCLNNSATVQPLMQLLVVAETALTRERKILSSFSHFQFALLGPSFLLNFFVCSEYLAVGLIFERILSWSG